MLDVGPAGLGDGGHVEAVAEGEEVLLVGAELVVAGERGLHALVLAAAAVLGLLFFDAGREGDFVEAFGHVCPRGGASYGFARAEWDAKVALCG